MLSTGEDKEAIFHTLLEDILYSAASCPIIALGNWLSAGAGNIDHDT